MFLTPISCTHSQKGEERNVAAVFNVNQNDPRTYKSGVDGQIYRSVGKVSCQDKTNSDRITATGSLISSCHLITNHHFWRECDKERKNIVSFEYDHNGSSFQKRTLISLSSKGTSREEKTKESMNDPDWAIYKMSSCAEKDLPKFDVCNELSKKELEEKKIELAGLSFDRVDDKGISVDSGCSVFVSDSGNFLNYGHDCASRSKTSGAPLYYLAGDRACLVGIHSSCHTNSSEDRCDTGIVSKFYDENTFNWAIPAKFFNSAIKALNQ